MSFSLRVPSLDDAERIAALHVATWQEAYADLLRSDRRERLGHARSGAPGLA